MLALGYACKKNDVVWPVAKNTGSSVAVNPGDSLDSVAVFTVSGSKAFPPNTNTPKTVLGLGTTKYPSSTTYYFTVSFQVFAANDIDYTKSLYTNTYQGVLDSTTMQVVIPIHYNRCIQRSLFTVSYTKEVISTIAVKDSVGYNSTTKQIIYKTVPQTDTTYQSLLPATQPVGSGSEANGSGNCESFTKGIVNDTTYMIFSQTGSAVLD